MFLFKRRGKCYSIKHPLGRNLPERLSDEDLTSLVNRLRANDVEAIGPIITNFTGLAVHIAGQYANRARNKADEYASEAFVGILEACRAVQEGKLIDDNITGFIATYIHRAITDYIKTDRVIKTPYTTSRRRKAEGKNPQVEIEPITGKILKHTGKISGPSMLEIKDMLERAMRTQIDRTVIELSSQSYLDDEIAEMLRLSTTRITQIRQRVRARYQELEREP